MVAWGSVGEVGMKRGKRQRGTRKPMRVMDILIMLITVMVSQLYTYIKFDQIVDFQYFTPQ